MVNDTDYEVSSGNVFADLGVDAADEMLAKAKLATAILDVIKKRGLTQHQAAKLLNADRSYISKLNVIKYQFFDIVVGKYKVANTQVVD